MKKIGELLEEQKQFVGRSEELSLMKQQLTEKGEHWSFIHFYGPVGMGKTTLMRYFQQSERGGFPVLYIDGQDGFHEQSTFLQALRKSLLHNQLLKSSLTSSDLIKELNGLAQEYGTVLLLLDGLDRWTIQPWLREEWLSRLSIRIRICSAGRRPLLSWQKAFGWGDVINNRELPPFSKTEWLEYLSRYGITDAPILDRIGRLTEGIPLALSLTCNRLVHSNLTNLADEDDQRNLIYSLVQLLVQSEEIHEWNFKLLSMASMVYVFDQELLERMLDEPISEHEFMKLCQSPYVKMHAKLGWSVKIGIRKWIRMNFKLRYPEKYELYKQRAEQVLERRIRSSGPADQRLLFELLIGKWFLQENEFLHSFVYYNEEREFTQRNARKEDLPRLMHIYQKNIQAFPPYLPDDTHQEQYLQDIWNVDPGLIQVFEHKGVIAGFYCAMQLNRNIQSILANNPALKPLLLKVQPKPGSWFYWLAASDPPMDQTFMAYFLHHIFFPKLSGKHSICMSCSSELGEAMELTGFQRLPQAAFTSKEGLYFSFFQLDLSPTVDWSAPTPSGNQAKLPTQDEWLELARQLLLNYSKLRMQTALLLRYKQTGNIELTLPELADQLERWLQNYLKRLNNGTEKEQMQAKILQHAYLQKIGTHEIVAARLNLPMSTYYRYVKKLTEGIAGLLQMQARI